MTKMNKDKKIIDSFLKYLEKHGQKKNIYWRLRHCEVDTDLEFSNVFFKGDYFLATLKAYNHLKSQKHGEYLKEIITRNITDDMTYMGISIEESTEFYMKGQEEDNDGNIIENNFGGPFDSDNIWIEEIGDSIRIF